MLQRAFGHRSYYLIAQRDGLIEGILPLAHVRSRLFSNALISTPFCVYGGVVAATPEAYRELVDRACHLADELGVDYLECRNLVARENVLAGERSVRDLPQGDPARQRSQFAGDPEETARHGA